MTETDSPSPVVLFDGECAFCDGAVHWIVDRDADGRFRFASLQSHVGRSLAETHGIDVDETDSLVLIADDRGHLHSSAALGVAKRLPWPWRLLFVLWVIPAPLRDLGYKLFARHRYRLFGRKDLCRLPTPELRERLLK